MINVLSVDKINSITPYHVQLFEKDGSYRFVTDNDVKLAVSFMYDDMTQVSDLDFKPFEHTL